ncbi:hypothetical protein K474DRAFT_1210904 [Panus rudis PR-1116 ss-1]|nr:hypothetical protein K474DRAFT_1210904 [Panus rudis PR-1116 ss-1]
MSSSLSPLPSSPRGTEVSSQNRWASSTPDHDGTDLGIETHFEQALSGLSSLRKTLKQREAEVASLEAKLQSLEAERKKQSDKHEAAKHVWRSAEGRFQSKIRELSSTHVERIKRLEEETKQKSYVTCFIDGNSLIFSSQYLSRGHAGGQAAAQFLLSNICDYLAKCESFVPEGVSVFCFVSKNLVTDLLSGAGLATEKLMFEQFMQGFNQASPGLLMVDVGVGQETPESKIKAFLSAERMYAHSKVIIGGSHDKNQYLDIIARMSVNANTPILLTINNPEHLALVKQYELNAFVIGTLFMDPESLTMTPCSGQTQPANQQANTVVNQSTRDTTPATPSTKPRRKRRTKQTDSIDTSSVSADTSEPHSRTQSVSGDPQVISSGSGMLQMQEPPRDKYLDKLDPPPCHAYYLRNDCTFPGCPYGHHWILSDERIAELKKLAKGLVCKAVAKGAVCPFGDLCIYGHKCPRGKNCSHLTKDRCHFVAPGMHDELEPSTSTTAVKKVALKPATSSSPTITKPQVRLPVTQEKSTTSTVPSSTTSASYGAEAPQANDGLRLSGSMSRGSEQQGKSLPTPPLPPRPPSIIQPKPQSQNESVKTPPHPDLVNPARTSPPVVQVPVGMPLSSSNAIPPLPPRPVSVIQPKTHSRIETKTLSRRTSLPVVQVPGGTPLLAGNAASSLGARVRVMRADSEKEKVSSSVNASASSAKHKDEKSKNDSSCHIM